MGTAAWLTVIASMVGYLAALFCAGLLLGRAGSRRTRLISGVIGAVALLELLRLVRGLDIWAARAPALASSAIPDLIISAMLLVCVFLLHLEASRERGEKEWLRLADALRQRSEELGKALEEARQGAEVKKRFLTNMSHELRTPLAGVLGTVELLAMTRLDAEQKEHVEAIRESAKSLLDTLDDILRLSDIEAGEVGLEHKEFAVEEQLSGIVSELYPAAAEKGLQLRLELGAGVPARLVGDGRLLECALVKLVENAIKFTEAGDVVIGCEVEKQTEHVVRLRFTVRDTGIGILPHQLELIFEAFTQVEDSLRRRHGGTGVGLTIARRLVELMGGEIECESAPGQGTTFRISLDFDKADHQGRETQIAAPAA